VVVTRGPNPLEGRAPAVAIGLDTSGAVHAIHVRGLVSEAVRHDCVLEVVCSVGDFVPLGSPVIQVYPSGKPPDARQTPDR
jgi:uncharacterized membrane protein